MFGNEFWRSIDLKKLQLPDDIILKKDCVTVNEGVKSIDVSMYYHYFLLNINTF